MAPQHGDEIGDDGARPTFPKPDGGPGDWDVVVHGTVLSALGRLAEWTGGSDTRIDSKTSPAEHFAEVGPKSLGVDGDRRPIYVVVHGWAPGYRSVVEATGGKVRWWDDTAHVDGRWASDWCWSPVSGAKGLEINDTGMVQQLARMTDATGGARILAFSWIDDSATDTSPAHVLEVYRSETYTHLNGMRLASALDQAIDRTFFEGGGEVRLIGHSHGSKVCTVAAVALEARGLRAARLAILDSPESGLALRGNAANLLGFHLGRLTIKEPTSRHGPGTYVDTYPSYFGVRYESSDADSPLQNIVDVELSPGHADASNSIDSAHTYAAAWYGGAAPHDLGPAWPPVPAAHEPALLQPWAHPGDQWTLVPGQPTLRARYDTHPLAVATHGHPVGVQVGPDGTLEFDAAGGNPYGSYDGTYPVGAAQFGLAFDLMWMSTGLFVVVGGHRDGTWRYTLLVLDGSAMPRFRPIPIGINSTISELIRGHAAFQMYYLPSGSDPAPADGVGLTISNIRSIDIT